VPPAPGAVTIAVVDDRVDLTNPDLAANTRQLNPGPVLGPHGTMVASAAAGAFNGVGVFGIFPSAPILSVGLPPQITCADAANAIVAAANAKAKVINLSFGSPSDCATLFGAVQVAFAKGSLVVAAAGNEFASGNPVIFPAAYPHVLSVAALDPTLEPSSFSSENTAVDVAAPGVDIPLAIPLAFDTDDGSADGITLGSGTSFATPMVSGAAAWLATARPTLSNGQLADVLRRSAKDVATPGYDPSTGYGLIQMGAALNQPTPEPDVLEPNDGISFVDGSVFSKADPYIWTGGAKRTLGGSADKIEDPVDVYRIRLPKRTRARIRLTPSFGNPDLNIFSSTAQSIDDTGKIVAKSRKATLKTDSVTIVNRGRSEKRYYVEVSLGADKAGALNAAYRLELQRIKLR
jgi:subtilisin family serine protease